MHADANVKNGIDLQIQELQVASDRFLTVASDVILDAAGQAAFGFIEPNKPYKPKNAITDEVDNHHAKNSLIKKPAKIREEVLNRNKQLLEGAFHGTLHLFVDYAGEYKHLLESRTKLGDRLKSLKEQIERKYPLGTWSMLGGGKYKILPEWDAKGKKQIEPQKLAPPPAPPKLDEHSEPDVKEKMLFEHRMEMKKYEKMTKRAARIAVDAKNPKKLKEMLEELSELRRALKDLESDSTKMRAGSIRDQDHTDPKDPRALPRGELVRIERTLTQLKEDKYPGSKTILETLIEAGADVNYANEDGFTALMFAARNGHTETVKHLLNQNGIDTHRVNKVNRNAMHYAALFAHKDIVELLRKVGCVNRRERDTFGLTPKECAESEGKKVLEAKQRIWNEMVYKGQKFKLVPSLEKTDNPESSLLGQVYNFFGIHDPDEIKPPKEWKPGQWRISKVPDPACKLDPMPEEKFIQRWSSASKKCGPPVKAQS